MSQVSYMPMHIPLEHLAWAPHVAILVASGPERADVFNHIVFPKETHYTQSAESVYTDYEHTYRIVRVIRDRESQLKAGDTVKIYDPPAYDRADIEASHTIGLMTSPCILMRTPIHPIGGNEMILFIQSAVIDGKKTWKEAGREGLAAEAEIRKLLDVPEDQRNLYFADKLPGFDDDPLDLGVDPVDPFK